VHPPEAAFQAANPLSSGPEGRLAGRIVFMRGGRAFSAVIRWLRGLRADARAASATPAGGWIGSEVEMWKKIVSFPERNREAGGG